MLGGIDCGRMQNMNVHEAYSFFRSSLQAAIAKHIPKVRSRSCKSLYINSKAMKMKREKDCRWSAYVQSHDPIEFARHCSYCNKHRPLTRKLTSEFEQQISTELKSKPKIFWRYTNPRMKTKVVSKTCGIKMVRCAQMTCPKPIY